VTHLNAHRQGVSRPDGRFRNGRKAAGEESPGSIDMRCRITSGGGDPRESATENEPLRTPQGGRQQGWKGAARAHRGSGNGTGMV